MTHTHIPEVETGNLAIAIAERCPALTEKRSVDSSLVTPFVSFYQAQDSISDNPEVLVLGPDDPEVPADAPASTQDPTKVSVRKVPA